MVGPCPENSSQTAGKTQDAGDAGKACDVNNHPNGIIEPFLGQAPKPKKKADLPSHLEISHLNATSAQTKVAGQSVPGGRSLAAGQPTGVGRSVAADQNAGAGRSGATDQALPAKANPATVGANPPEKPGQAGKPATEWTVVVDLGILFDQSGTRGHLGAEDKAKALEELKASTKGKPVAIVVEELVAPPVPAGQDLSDDKKPYEVKRFVLRDGQESEVYSGPSKQMKGDLGDLLDFALTQEPGSKVALAINAHGLGDQGVTGGMEPGRRNGGLVSPSDLAGVIQSSLAKTGKPGQQLDLLDLDSCLMAEKGVLTQLAPETQQLVASERTETVGTQPQEVDGQNLTAWVKDVIAKPEMSGFDLGQDIVAHANSGDNGRVSEEQGTATLVHFDLKGHLQEFDDRLNQLGDQLKAAMKDPANRQEITNAIDLLPDEAYNGKQREEHLPATEAKRDMAEFLHLLARSIAHKSISDPDGQLAQSVSGMESYLKDSSKLLAGVHLPKPLGSLAMMSVTGDEGGLSIFLPTQQIRMDRYLSDANLHKLDDIETGTESGGWSEFLQSLRPPTKPSNFPGPIS